MERLNKKTHQNRSRYVLQNPMIGKPMLSGPSW